MLRIWSLHDISVSEKLKLDYLNNEKSFQSETKSIFSLKVLSFRLNKNTRKNVADIFFNKTISSCQLQYK